MKKLVAQLTVLGTAVIMLISFTACGYPIDKFKSLEEMQAVFPKDVYYFDFEQEGIKEAGKFEAERTTHKRSDGSYNYIRYSIWYDVKYTIDGQKQERKLRVVAAEKRYPMSSIGKNTETYRPTINKIFDYWHDTVDIEEFSFSGVAFDENKKVLSLSASSGYYFYYFFLEEGVQADFIKQELESFLSICEFAIDNRYQIT